MKTVEELYGKHPGADIYVVGTGASMRVFPTEFLHDKITIGLNMAWKLVPVKYSITIRPELNIPEFMGEGERPDITWCISPRKLTTPEQREYVENNPVRFFAFDTKGQHNPLPNNEPGIAGRIPEWVRRPTQHFLYVWTSISQTAANLAANMGAKNIILVGCDNCALGGNHHAHKQHTFWKGADPDLRYRQYEEGTAEVRALLRERNVNMLSMSPFISLERPVEDFNMLCNELNQKHYISNHDITPKPIHILARIQNSMKRIPRGLIKVRKRITGRRN